MTSTIFLLHLLLLLLLLLLAFPFPNSQFLANGNMDLIQSTCKKTRQYDLCVSSLKSNPSSTTADTKGLALIMIGVGMANSTAISSYLQSQTLLPVKNKTANDTTNIIFKKVLKECADKYTSAGDAFQDSAQDLATESYDYAYMHVMAAADYPNACRNAFRRYPGLTYPPEIARREDGLKHICDVVLGIIDALAL